MIQSVSHLAKYYLKTDVNNLRDLAKNSNRYFSNYTQKKKKDDGTIKERIVYKTEERLKKIHKLLLINVLKKIVLPSPPFIGGLKGKDNVLNAYFHQGKPFKFCTDLKNFFPHINNKMIYKAFVDFGFSADVSSIMTKLITHNGKLIQGGVTSTYVAYLVMHKCVLRIKDICDANDIVFTIYVDDMTFSSEKDFKELSVIIRDIIIEEGFFVNHKKTFFTKGRAKITGIVVGQNSLNVDAEFRRKLFETSSLTINQKKGLENYYMRVIAKDKKKV